VNANSGRRKYRALEADRAALRRALRPKRGKEVAQQVQFRVDTGVQVYFCDPKSPWRRGSNEKTNGLLREYLPKSADLSQCTQRKLDAIARSLNTRPRHTLGWMTHQRRSSSRSDDHLRTQPIRGTQPAKSGVL
jgi:IS30 family transposase